SVWRDHSFSSAKGKDDLLDRPIIAFRDDQDVDRDDEVGDGIKPLKQDIRRLPCTRDRPLMRLSNHQSKQMLRACELEHAHEEIPRRAVTVMIAIPERGHGSGGPSNRRRCRSWNLDRRRNNHRELGLRKKTGFDAIAKPSSTGAENTLHVSRSSPDPQGFGK